MTSMNETMTIAANAPLSMKAACLGFFASTTLLTALMTIIGNLH